MPADPYRTFAIAASRRKSRPIDATRPSSVPLGIIAFTFFLPVTHDCNNQLESPVGEAAKSFFAFIWIAPLFLAAAALCLSIIHTYTTRTATTRVATAFVGVHVLSAAVIAVVSVVGDKKGTPWLLASIPALVLFTVAWWRRGLRRLSLLIDAYLVASLPLAGLVVMVADVYGGYLFGFAFALLILLRVAQLVSRLISR